MYIDLLKHLESLENTLGRDSQSYKAVSQAFKEHPNLRAYLDHMGVIRLCSVDMNPCVSLIDITHRTDHGSLEILPYVKDQGTRIYADPPIYVVGYQNPKGFGEVPLPDWEALLEDAGIAPEVVAKIRWYLKAHQPVNYEDIPDEEAEEKSSSSGEAGSPD